MIEINRGNPCSVHQTNLNYFETRKFIKNGVPTGIGKSPEIPRLLVQWPCLMAANKADRSWLHYLIHFDSHLPRHEQVFKSRDRIHSVEMISLKMVRKLVR